MKKRQSVTKSGSKDGFKKPMLLTSLQSRNHAPGARHWIAFATVALFAACSEDAGTPLGPDSTEITLNPQLSRQSGPRTLYSIDNLTAALRSINPVTGATLTGPLPLTIPGFPVAKARGLATDPATGSLYALVSGSRPQTTDSHSRLVTVDPATGEGTLIANLGDVFASIAFTCTELYGVTGEKGTPSESLFTIDKATGVTAFLTSLGNGDDGEAIGYNPHDGLMYHASGHAGQSFWESIDLTTRAVTPIFGPSITNYDEALGLAYDDANGTFLFTDNSQSGPGLFSMTTDGTATPLGTVDSNGKGLAFVPTFSCNQPPSADAGEDQSVEWHSTDGGAVTLDGSGSSDPEGDPVIYSWSEAGVEIATGVNPTVNLALGEHTLTLTVTQADGGCDSDEVVITVVDTTPPDVTASFEPVPGQRLTGNHGVFTVVFSCSDACDENPLASATLNGIAVTNGQVVNLRLRSERFMEQEASRNRSSKSGKSAHSNKSGKSGKSAHSDKSGKSGKSDRPEEPMVIDGSSFSLLVTCVDESGNVGVGEAEPTFAEKSLKQSLKKSQKKSNKKNHKKSDKSRKNRRR